MSELTWRGVDSPVTEVHAEAVFRQRLVLQGTMGIGPIIDGTFIDNDYAADDRQNRFSSTRSDATGEALVYFTMDVGFRLVSWAQPHSHVIGYVQAFTGYQFWTEYYEASGANGTVSIPDDEVVVEETFTFQSIRLGAEAMVPVYRGLALRLRGVYLPWTRSDLRDKHPLRGDLEQDPSFKATAEGGTGTSWRAPSCMTWGTGSPWRPAIGTGGSNPGTARSRRARRSGDVKSKLNEIIIERYGPWVGVTYRF